MTITTTVRDMHEQLVDHIESSEVQITVEDQEGLEALPANIILVDRYGDLWLAGGDDEFFFHSDLDDGEPSTFFDIEFPMVVQNVEELGEFYPVFTEGDRVEVVGYGYGWDGPGTVVDLHTYIVVEPDARPGDRGGFRPANVVPLVEESAPEPELSFQVGDRVVIDFDRHREQESNFDGPGTVIGRVGGGYYEVRPDHFQDDYGIFVASELTLIEDEPAAADEIVPGDRVRFTFPGHAVVIEAIVITKAAWSHAMRSHPDPAYKFAVQPLAPRPDDFGLNPFFIRIEEVERV